MEIVDTVDRVALIENPDWIPDGNLSEFDLNDECYIPSGGTLVRTPTALTYDLLQSIDQREELRELAFRAYYAAVDDILAFADDSYIREGLYLATGDTWFEGIDPDNSTGLALAGQMFASLSTIIDRMKDIKIDSAQERVYEGVSQGDQWGDTAFGRVPALEHIYGNLELVDGQWVELHNDLLPNQNAPLPEMSNRLQQAISLLDKHKINFTYYARAYMDSDQDPSTFDSMKSEIFQRENTSRSELGLSLYSDLDDLALANGTTVDSLVDAAMYMYSHLLLFPRRTAVTVASKGPDDEFEGWTAPSMRVPLGVRTVGYQSNYSVEDDGFPTIASDTRVQRVGLVPVFRSMRKRVQAARKTMADNPILAYPIFEKNNNGNMDESERETTATLGERRIVYWITPVPDDRYRLEISIINPTVDDPESPSEVLDELAVYPIGGEEDGQDQLKNMLCFHQEGCDGFCEGSPSECECGPPDCDCCGGQYQRISGFDCSFNSFGDYVCSASEYVYLSAANQFWMVELRTGQRGGEAPWKSVGVIDAEFALTADDGGVELTIGGLANIAASKTTSFNPDDINVSICDYTTDISEASECIDPNWVPAIDNELIDTSGNQYEESYRHYLDIARIAADKARQMREELINDIISEAHDEALQEAQLQNALDDYIGSIKQICGDQIEYDFADWVELAESGSSSESFEDFLTNQLDKCYGCEISEFDFEQDPYSCDVEREGPVHCAIPRRCGAKTKLSDLGLFSYGASDFSNMMLGTQIFFMPVSEPLSDEEILFPEDSGLFQPMFGSHEQVDQWLMRLRLWLAEYKSRLPGIVGNEGVYDMPDLSGMAPEGDGLDFFNTAQLDWLQQNYGYGEYFDAMNEMANTIDSLTSTGQNYLAELDNAAAIIDALAASLDLSDTQAELQIKQQLAAAVAQGAAYRGAMEDQTKQCIENITEKYSSIMTKSTVYSMILQLDDNFWDDSNRKEKWGNINSPSEFQAICLDAAGQSGGPLSQYSAQVCMYLRTIRGGATWISDSSGPELEYYCFEDYDNCVFRPSSSEDIGGKTIGGSCWRGLSLPCLGQWYSIGNGDDILSCNSPTMYDLCADKGHDKLRYWYNIRDSARDELKHDIWEYLRSLEYEQCGNENGCQVTSEGDFVEGSCHGAATDVYNDMVGKWTCGSMKSISGGGDGEFCQLAEEAEFLQNQVSIANFVQQMIQVGKALAEARYGVSQLIRKLASDIGRLSQLEEKQVDLFRDFINSKNISEASSYSSLPEWQARFDFRRDQYKKQLKRARTAAWVARRAIEFRFGVNLSKETVQSIYGDSPSEWADSIAEQVSAYCGDELDEDESEGTGIDECLRPEELIEEYVQKLEDYVESYGNSPYDDYWWFHEDDDTGVVSLRDHLTTVNETCDTSLGNMLFFSEELNMNETAVSAVYGDDIEDVGYSVWERMGVDAVETDVELLGLPQDVEAGHDSSETDVFGDQQEPYTADHVLAALLFDPEAEVKQTVQLTSELIDHVGEVSDLNFSAYLRDYPHRGEQPCAEGETYFPEFGRCGVPCEVDDDSAPWGDCPVPPEPYMERQICIRYENEDQGESGPSVVADICGWCTADKGCVAQDGQAARLVVSNDTEGGFADKNVTVKSHWTRETVNTEQYEIDTIPAWSAEDLVTVAVQTTDTQNLVETSEDALAWDCDVGAITDSEAPDGAMTAQTFTNLNRCLIQTTGDWSEGALTGSIWVRSDEEDQAVELMLMNGDSEIGKVFKVSSDWTRIAVEARYLAGPVDFLIRGADGLMNVTAWGAQLEKGLGVTPYLPTGKNLLANSNNLVSWTGTASASPSGSPGPGNVESVYTLSDDDADVVERRRQDYTDLDAGIEAGSYIFSVWMKSDTTHTARLILRDMGGGSSYDSPLDVTVRDEWQRYSVTHTVIENEDNPAETLRAVILPVVDSGGVGSVDVFGPQLEPGSAATGYQETDAIGNKMVKVWGFDLGAVGAQLMPTRAFTCDDEGNPVITMGQCETEYTEEDKQDCCDSNALWAADFPECSEQVEFFKHCMTCTYSDPPGSVCVEDEKCMEGARECNVLSVCEWAYEGEDFVCTESAGSYTRNTYLREHYFDICTVDSTSDSAFPLPDNLYAFISNEVRQQYFKNKFTRVTTGDQSTYNYSFTLDMDAIENGSMGDFGILAQSNFNYRVRTVALNIVGTDVIDCSKAESPSTCDANPWLSYDLKQYGDVWIRNHHEELSVQPFNIPTGRISGGKAWAAEQVIGYPLSGAHQSAMTQLNKIALMGRPLEGTFELRIYDVPELVWENVEDIQIVLGYHYWTRSE